MNKSIIVLGDLNYNMSKNGPDCKALTEVSMELNLTQIIEIPTRIAETSQTLIDVILVSSTALVLENGVLSTSISDHLPVYAFLNLKVAEMPARYITKRSYKNYNPSQFPLDLATKSDCSLHVLSEPDDNTALKAFNDVLHSTLEMHAPLKTFKVRSRPCPFVSRKITELMKSRDRLFRRFRQTHDKKDCSNYKVSRNNVKTKIKNAAKTHIMNEVREHTNNSVSMWKIINSLIRTKEKNTHVYTKDLKAVAEGFNEFFISVGRNVAAAATNMAKDNDIVQSNPFLNAVTYPQSVVQFQTRHLY